MKKIGLSTLSMYYDKLEPLPMDLEKLMKLMEEMANAPKENLSSEEFEKKYPRRITPYERQRMENKHA